MGCCMEINTYDFKNENFDNLILVNHYHCLYILEGDKHLYIGETSRIKERIKEHKNNRLEEVCDFHTIHMVTDEYSNATIMRHYERLLVSLMLTDGKYVIHNRKNGYQYTFYYNKNEYELKFDKLWFLLEKKGLVKEKKLKNLFASDEFSHCPFRVLNDEQTKALTAIINVLDSKETEPVSRKFKAQPILIKGMPGTGKTVLAITLFDYLKCSENHYNKKIAIVISNPSLRAEIEYAISCMGYGKNNVISPIEMTKQKYDIVICDEAQKLRRYKNLNSYSNNFKKGNERLGLDNTHDELDWLLMQAKTVILFYDANQIVSPCAVPLMSFESRIKGDDRGFRPIELKKQMRVQAGRGYVKYIHDILYGKNPSQKKFSNYIFKIVDSYDELDKIILEKENNFGLSRRASGYGFEYRKDGTINSHTIVIDGKKATWNTCTKGWMHKDSCRQEIGSIYTLCGIDLNYAGVVIGPELYYDLVDKKIKLNKKEFYDNTVKRQQSQEEIYKEVLNAYIILLTRAIKGTYVYVCDKNLREYLKCFISYDA